MSKYERGVYEPSDEVRVFDGAEDEDDAEGSRLPLLIVLALLVLAMFGGLVWLAYTQGVARGRTETPVLAAAPGPERVAPANAGGSNVPYQGFKIYEQPAPADDDSQAAAPQKPAAPAAPAPAPAPEKLAQAAQPAPVPVVAPAPKPAPKPEPVAAPPPRPAITASAPPPAPKPLPKPVTVAKAPPPAPVKAAPVSAPVSTVATGGPRTLPGVAAATPAPKPVAAPAPVKAITGAFVLQIGAYKSQDDADAAWKTYKAKHAALLSGYGPDVQKADLGDKGTWYRLRIAGFSDRDVASALCDRLKADGGGCFLGK